MTTSSWLPADAVLPVSERRDLIVVRLGDSPEWTRSRRLIAWMEHQKLWSRPQGQCDLRELVKAGRIERRIEGGGTSAHVWYRGRQP